MALGVLAGCGQGDSESRSDRASAKAEPRYPESRLAPTARQYPPSDQLSVLLICVDTLRADHLGSYGYSRNTSPFLDELASQGTRFEHCFSTYPQTAASVASIFTSMYPSSHKAVRSGLILGPEPITLAEIFREVGYRTVAVATNPHLSPGYGYDQGFEDYYYVVGSHFESMLTEEASALQGVNVHLRDSAASFYGRGDKVNAAALEWLDGSGSTPFFLYLHYMDVHNPYESPEPYHSQFVSRPGTDLYTKGVPESEPTPEDLQFTIDLYDGQIAYLDDLLKDLWGELERRQLLDQVVLAFTADHGDELMDHGGFGHGRTLYRELVHVPLFFVGPGIESRVVSSQVSTLDVLPTLCALAGVDSSPYAAGEDLSGMVGEFVEEGPPRVILSECSGARLPDGTRHTQVALTTDRWRLLHASKIGHSQLYEYRKDPGELQDRESQDPELTNSLIAEARDLLEIAKMVGKSVQSLEIELSQETLDQLQALGYTE